MSILTRATRSHIPEDGILISHRRENLKSYIDDLLRRRVSNFVAVLRLQSTSYTASLTAVAEKLPQQYGERLSIQLCTCMRLSC
jgi:hypothetical protein